MSLYIIFGFSVRDIRYSELIYKIKSEKSSKLSNKYNLRLIFFLLN